MEVVREVFKHSSAHGARAAIRADHKSYGFVQLISSALDVHNILRTKNVPPLLSHLFIWCAYSLEILYMTLYLDFLFLLLSICKV
jgi:hypothetical protein